MTLLDRNEKPWPDEWDQRKGDDHGSQTANGHEGSHRNPRAGQTIGRAWRDRGQRCPPRSEVVSKIWAYIKAEKLQNPDNKREIVADDKLKKIFGKDRVSMFEMNKHISQHLTKA